MADNVALSFTYERGDFVSAARWVIARNPRTYLSCALFALVFALVGFLVWWYDDQALGLTMILASPALGLFGFPIMLSAVGAHARKSFDANPAFQNDFHWQLNASELTIKGKGLSAELELNNFQRAAETRQGFLLWQTPVVYNYLPKRAIPDAATRNRIRAILRAGLPGTARINLRDD